MKLLILAPYPLGAAPSQRFRFELFLDHLTKQGVSYDFQSFLSEKGWNIIYSSGHWFGKFWSVIMGFGHRKLLFLRLHRYDIVMIHRELTPFGPPIFEWFIAKVWRKKVIYDFDDAIWLPDQVHESKLWKILKWRSKVASICRWSWKVSAGNEFLANFAKQYCDTVVVLPTVVDTEVHHPPLSPLEGGQAKSQKPKAKSQEPKAKSQKPVIGWTGSHSTLFYLETIVPVLQELEKELDFEFVIIANKNPELSLKNFRFVPWSIENETKVLEQVDIGIMPLEDTEWAKGKCGFKLIQYLAMGIPSVASPVGVNCEIVKHGENGLLASSEKEWIDSLKKLLSSPYQRWELGENGRETVILKYSVESNESRFLNLFSSEK